MPEYPVRQRHLYPLALNATSAVFDESIHVPPFTQGVDWQAGCGTTKKNYYIIISINTLQNHKEI
jgi:hypothetical protein